ncbi:MAG: MFS transporter [Steroidobacteraceae bacterium]
MRTTLGATWTLLLGMALLMLGGGLQGTLVALRATLEGYSTLVTGLILAAYYVGYVAGSAAAPRLVRDVGHIRVFAAFCALAAVVVLSMTFLIAAPLWIALRFVSGFCFAGLYVVAESWLNDQSSATQRGALLAVYMLICFGGQGLGQLLLNLADPASVELFMLVAILIALALVPMALASRTAPAPRAAVAVRVTELYRMSPLGVVGVTMSGAISGCLFSLGAVYVARLGFDAAEVASFMAAAILAACLTQLPVGRLSDRVDRRFVLVAACVLSAAAALSAAQDIARGGAWLLPLIGIYGGFSLTLYALNLAHINDQLSDAQMLSASGTIVLLNGAGAAVGPVLVAAIMQKAGNGSFLYLLAAMHISLAAFSLYRIVRRAPVPAPQKSPFVSTPPGTSSSGELFASASHPHQSPTATADEDS